MILVEEESFLQYHLVLFITYFIYHILFILLFLCLLPLYLILIYACYAIEIYILSKSFSQKQPFDVFCYIGVLLISDKPSLKFVTKTLKGTCQEVHSWNMKNSEGLKSTPERKNNNFSTGIFHRFCLKNLNFYCFTEQLYVAASGLLKWQVLQENVTCRKLQPCHYNQ